MNVLTLGPDREPITLFLHGFPSVRSKQNVEIAEHFVSFVQRRVHVPFYAGLGRSPGVFRFSECLQDVRQYFKKLVDIAKGPIDIVGHSWGGYLAMTLACEFPGRVRKMVLMSPLLDFGVEEKVEHGFTEYAKYPQLSLGDVSALVRDFYSVASLASGADLIARVPESTNVLFMQAKNDAITPPAIAENAVKSFKKPAVFELVENDHSFLAERKLIAERIARFLK